MGDYNRGMTGNNKLTKIQEDLYYDERSAGGIVYRAQDKQILWLVIKTLTTTKYSNKNGKLISGTKRVFYKFPKGHLQINEFLKKAALREVEEEAKVKAEIKSKIGSNNYVIWDKLKRRKLIKKVTFYLMKYTGESDLQYNDTEMVIGKEWLQYEEASQKLTYDSEKVLLGKAKARLKM